MSRPRFSFRPNLQNEEHRKAWDILQSVPEGQRNTFIARAILEKARQDFAQAVYYLTKSIVFSRLIVLNNGWKHMLTDFVTLHDYAQTGEVLQRYRQEDLAYVLNGQIRCLIYGSDIFLIFNDGVLTTFRSVLLI